MRNLFILVVFIIFILTIKGNRPEELKKLDLERLDVKQSQVIDFNGSLFLPRTIQVRDDVVKDAKVVLSLHGKTYTYSALYDTRTFWLDPSQVSEEIAVEKGDVIAVTTGTTLFFTKEM